MFQSLAHLIPICSIGKSFSILSDNNYYLSPVPAEKTYGIFSAANHQCLHLLGGELIQEITSSVSHPVVDQASLIIAACKTANNPISKINVWNINGEFIRTVPGIPVGNILLTQANVQGNLCPILIAACKEHEASNQLWLRLWRLDTGDIVNQVAINDRNLAAGEQAHVTLLASGRPNQPNREPLIFLGYKNFTASYFLQNLAQSSMGLDTEFTQINKILNVQTIINSVPDTLVLAATDSGIICREMRGIGFDRIPVNHISGVLCMAVTDLVIGGQHRKIVISSSLDGELKIWDLDSKKVLESIYGFGVVSNLAIAKNGDAPYLIVASKGVTRLELLALRAIGQHRLQIRPSDVPEKYQSLVNTFDDKFSHTAMCNIL